MTDIKELFDVERQAMLKMKQTKFDNREDDDGDFDLWTQIHGYRDGEAAMFVILPPDRDAMLTVIRMMVSLMLCDTVFACYETYHTTRQNNPLSGQPWEPGEMQYVQTHYPEAGAEGWVREALTMCAWDIKGNQAFSSAAFWEEDGVLVWGDDSEHTFSIVTGPDFNSEEGEKLEGLVNDHIKESFDMARVVGPQYILSQAREFGKMLGVEMTEVNEETLMVMDLFVVVQLHTTDHIPDAMGAAIQADDHRLELMQRLVTGSPLEKAFKTTVVGPDDDQTAEDLV